MANVAKYQGDPDPIKRAIYWLVGLSWQHPNDFEAIQELSRELEPLVALTARAAHAEADAARLRDVLRQIRRVADRQAGDYVVNTPIPRLAADALSARPATADSAGLDSVDAEGARGE